MENPGKLKKNATIEIEIMMEDLLKQINEFDQNLINTLPTGTFCLVPLENMVDQFV